jgi:uncharacterized membrane protein YvbJ
MWICKHCGHEVDDALNNCPKCKTGKYWGASETEKRSAGIAVEHAQLIGNRMPISNSAIGFLRFMGIVFAIIGVISGVVILANAPSQNDDIAALFRTIHFAVGFAQIIGGITTGVLLYVVAGIGKAVLDLWEAQKNK